MADDYAASVTTRGRLAVNGSIVGVIEQTRDRDWFAVTLAAGWRYYITLQGQDTNQGTLADPALRLLDASGSEVAYDNDLGIGLESALFFTPPLSGNYYLSAEGADRWATGSYRLTINRDGADDYPASTLTSSRLTVGSSLNGLLEVAGDHDWCAVTLVAGHNYQINLVGVAVGAMSAVEDPALRLMDDAGTTLQYNDDIDTSFNAGITYRASRSGTYYLSAEGFNDETGGWRLTVTVADTVAPSVPTGLDLASADDSGLSNSDNITAATRGLTLSGGSGETGARVLVFDDNNNDGVMNGDEPLATIEVTATAWQTDLQLTTGTHRVSAIQVDAAGNRSKAATALLLTIDTTAPAPLTVLDLAAADDKGFSNSDNITSQTAALSLSSGSAENGALVTLFTDRNNSATLDNGEKLGTAAVVSNRWNVDAMLAHGNHLIRALASDRAGNVGPVSPPLTVTIIEAGRNNTLATATKKGQLGGTALSIEDFIGTDDSNDYYQFQLAAGTTLTATLDHLTANANLQLLNTKGALLDRGENSGARAESIRYSNNSLATTTCYLRVYPAIAGANTGYQLSMQG
ncbi:MAG: PPC domain-containing protein [Magnetococcales bacterium]|nr:PPC domain-containing protein [Magnetococcales bacterium]